MSLLIFPFRFLRNIFPGESAREMVIFPKPLYVERIVFDPCCQAPFDHPCAHVRLESASLMGVRHLFTRREGAWLSLRDGKAFYPKLKAPGVDFAVFNLSGMNGHYVGGFVEAIDLEPSGAPEREQ